MINLDMNKPMGRSYVPAVVAIAVLFILLLLLEGAAYRHTGGVFSYPLDDAFIHMAVAKNVAEHHNWGISAHGFQSASSSILYTLLLAGLFKIFSVHVILPFVVNIVAAVALLLVLQEWLLRQGLSGRAQLIVQVAVVLVTPLPILVMTGMEHTLQCLFCFLFLTRCCEWMDSEGPMPWTIPAYGLLITGIRYEGIFLAFVVCLMLLWRRRVVAAFLLGGISLLPILLFGLYSLGKGSYFFPNSVLLKSEGAQSSIGGIVAFLATKLLPKLITSGNNDYAAAATQRLLLILPLSGWFFRAPLRRVPAYGRMLVVLFFCTVLQLTFASTGWFYRYEAYLIFCSTALLMVLILRFGREVAQGERSGSNWLVPACLVIILFLPLAMRCGSAFAMAPRACQNIFEQQYQTGQFVHRWYRDDAFAVNDIGAVSLFSDADNLDMEGLGNFEVAKRRKVGTRSAGFLDSLVRAKRIDYAVVYQFVYGDSLLSRWRKVASWTIGNNVVCGSPTVYFYAIDPAKEDGFRRSLQAQEAVLPPGVTVKYY